MSPFHQRSGRALGLAAVVTAAVAFALSLSVIKWPGIPGSVIAWWRLVGSAAMWWVFLAVRQQRGGQSLPDRHAWKLATPAALAFGLNISLFFLALTRTSVAHADFIASMAPLVLIPAGFVLFGERPRWLALGWGGLSIIGLVIILRNGPTVGEATLGGDVLVAVGVLCFIAYQLLSKRARASGVEPWGFMAIVMTVALVTATPVALITAGDALWPLTAKAWASVAILSVMTGMLGHWLIYYAHKAVPVATISVIQTSQPSMSTFWAWLLLGEAVTAAQVPGMILATIGVTLVVWFSRRPAEAVST